MEHFIMTTAFHDFLEDHLKMTQELKEKAIAEYKDSLLMPRKKKKKFKKSALMLYSVACWAENIWYDHTR